MNLLDHPDKIESRDAFRAYLDAMLHSLDQALAAPPIPYGPAVDHQGVRWENMTLGAFLGAMDAWMKDTGWTELDRRASAVWAALSGDDVAFDGDEDDLRKYLSGLRHWASNRDLPGNQDWRPAAEALRAGRAYE
jgi:hypothetical protein